VHPANPSTIQSSDSPKLGKRPWVRTAKILISASNKSEKVHLIGVRVFLCVFWGWAEAIKDGRGRVLYAEGGGCER
jgi:hypothetical protein